MLGSSISIHADEAPHNSGLNILQVLPRGMFFSPSQATSIDLCVYDLVRASRFASTTRIIAEPIPNPFSGLDVQYFPGPSGSSTISRASFIARLARSSPPDVIVVQAHLPTAAAIAKRCPGSRVVLHSHGFQKSNYNRRSLTGALHRTFKRERYRRLAGIIHVSQACAGEFAAAWPTSPVRRPSSTMG